MFHGLFHVLRIASEDRDRQRAADAKVAARRAAFLRAVERGGEALALWPALWPGRVVELVLAALSAVERGALYRRLMASIEAVAADDPALAHLLRPRIERGHTTAQTFDELAGEYEHTKLKTKLAELLALEKVFVEELENLQKQVLARARRAERGET